MSVQFTRLRRKAYCIKAKAYREEEPKPVVNRLSKTRVPTEREELSKRQAGLTSCSTLDPDLVDGTKQFDA